VMAASAALGPKRFMAKLARSARQLPGATLDGSPD